MDKPVSKRRRFERSISPEKPKPRNKIAFKIKNPEKPKVSQFNSIFKNLRERSNTPEPVISSKKTPELRSKKSFFEKTEPEVLHKPQRIGRKKQTPEDTDNEKSNKADTEQLKISLPINLFDSNQRQSKEPKKNATNNNKNKKMKKDNEKTEQDLRNNNYTTENHNHNCQCIYCEFKSTAEEDEVVYVDTVELHDLQRNKTKQDYTRTIIRALLDIEGKMPFLLRKEEFQDNISNLLTVLAKHFDSLKNIQTTVESTHQKMEEKITNIDKRFAEMNQNHDKNWESVSETLTVLSKHIIDKSNIGSKGNNNQERGRNLESPTTTCDISCEDDILQKAEQFSEQNKAKLAKERAQNDSNEQMKTMDSQTLAKNQPFAKIAPNVMSQQQQVIQKTHEQLAKQQFAQHDTTSQMAWQLDQQPSRESIELKEQQVRQQIVNFYQQQQNTSLELQKASQYEQQMATQREKRTARQQEYEQPQHNAQASQSIGEQLEQLIQNNKQIAQQQRQQQQIAQNQQHQIAQQQQLVGQHEQIMARHNERLALHQAQLAQQQAPFANQQETQLANEPALSRDGMVVQNSAKTTPAINIVEQRVLRPRPTPQVVLQDPFVQPKQKAPRKLTAKQIRERRASIQCESPAPSPSYYPHLPSMRLPAPLPQNAHPVQRNVRLAEENFQQQVQSQQVYAALQNQEIHQQQAIKAAKLRARRATCQPSLSYLDPSLCHEMLRSRLTNAQVPNNHDQSSFYTPQQLRYFSNTPQPVNTSDNYSQYTQNAVPEMATPENGLNLSVNNIEQASQNYSQDPASWMRGRSASITRIPNTKG